MRPNVLEAIHFLPVADAPPLPSLPTGKLLLFWDLPAFPSVNEFLYLSPKARAQVEKAERKRGYDVAMAYAVDSGLRTSYQPYRGTNWLRLFKPLTVAPLFCFISVTRGDNRRRDIYNVAAKAFLDGCTDAGLWADDSEAQHTDVWLHFAGRGIAHRSELRFYAA